MKLLLSLLAVTFVSSAAFADVNLEANGGIARIYGCSRSQGNPGTAQAFMQGGSLIVRLNGIDDCTFVDGPGSVMDLRTGGSNRIDAFTNDYKVFQNNFHDGRNVVAIRLHSKTNQHSESINVLVNVVPQYSNIGYIETVKLGLGEVRPLGNCGGYVRANPSRVYGNITLSFEGATACNSVTIGGTTQGFRHGYGSVDVTNSYRGLNISVRTPNGTQVEQIRLK